MFKENGIKFTVLVLIVAGSCAVMAEEESKVEFEITADFYSKYIWRGIVVTDDHVFQPGASATFGGLTAGVWGNLELTDFSDNDGEFTEVDYYLDYSGDVPGVEGVGYSVGLIYYHFPSLVGDTTEVYLGLNFDLPLNPSVTVYHDIDVADGTYVSFGLEHSIESIGELAPDLPVGMDISASLGYGDDSYNDTYWGVDDDAVNDLVLSVAFPVELGGWTVAPSINYISLLDSDIRSSDGDSSDYFVTGISLSTSF